MRTENVKSQGLLLDGRQGFCSAEISGIIFNLDEIAQACGAKPVAPASDIILDAWKHFGACLVDHLRGDYALALFDYESQITVLITDAVGSRPCYYTCQNETCYAAFRPVELLDRPDLVFTKNQDWMESFLLGSNSSEQRDQTAYVEIRKVPAATIATFRKGKLVSTDTYEPWDYAQSEAVKSDAEWVDAHRRLFDQAVVDRIDPENPMLFENSGGLDSGSIITNVSNQLSPDARKNMYSVGTLRWENEQSWIPLVVETAAIEHHEWTLDDASLAQSMDIGLRVKGYPFYFSMEIPVDHLNTLSQSGAKVIYSGFGGDETVTQHCYNFSVEAYDKRDFKSLWRLCLGHPLKRPIRFIRLIKRSRRRKHDVPAFWVNQVATCFLRDQNAIDRHDRRVKKDFAKERAMDRTLNGSMRYALCHKPVFQTRMEDHGLYASAFGMRFSWPLLDRALLANFMATPSLQRVNPGKMNRYLHRRAVRGLVPDAIIDSDTKQMGKIEIKPDWFAAKHQDILRLGREMLDNLAQPLASIVDPAKIKAEIEKFADQTDVAQNQDVIAFWDKMRRVISLNHWCIHGR